MAGLGSARWFVLTPGCVSSLKIGDEQVCWSLCVERPALSPAPQLAPHDFAASLVFGACLLIRGFVRSLADVVQPAATRESQSRRHIFATPALRARIDSGLMPPVHRHMSRDLLTVEAELPVVAAAQRMAERNVGAVLVMEAGRLAGIMTERDLMRAFARGLRDDAVVGECMTANPETIAPDDTIEHAAVLMIHGGYRHLPVVDGDDPVGVLSIRDLVPVFLEDSAPRGA